jgi:hypothetical protein
MAPFGWFYVLLFALGIAGVRAPRTLPLPAGLACGTAGVIGIVNLFVRDPLPGLAGSAALVALLAIPIAGLVASIPRGFQSRTTNALLAASVLLVCVGWAMDLRAFARDLRNTHDATLAPLGKWMATWRADGTLLCDAPGAISYYSGWATTVVAGNAMPPGAPDLVILTSQGLFDVDMDRDAARVAAALTGRYRVLGAIRLDWTRDRAFIIYAREDIPVLDENARGSFPQGVGTVVRLNG